jgi:1-acyl-sn-glycerol-3-phosphate acyltransferase
MMAKKTLAAVPVVGWTLSLNKHIFIDRANRKSQIDALRRMDQLLIDGDSLMVYPEGTRTKDGDIAEFKKGAFRSAVATGTSVLPVVIKGAFEALPSKSMVVKGFHTITLSVLPSIDVEKGSSTADLAQKCHDLMSSELEHLRQA